MRKGFSVSATIEALQFLIPCTLCDELVVKGDDCPSWRVSLVVKFNIWLNKTRRVPILKLPISIRNNRKQRKNIKTTIERRSTEQLLILFFLPVKHPPFVLLFFTSQILLHKSRPYKKSASYSSTGAGHVFMGLPLIYGSPPRRGESEPSREGASPHSASRAADKNIVFTTTRYMLFAHRQVRCWMLGFRSCPTPLGTSRRGTLYASTLDPSSALVVAASPRPRASPGW